MNKFYFILISILFASNLSANESCFQLFNTTQKTKTISTLSELASVNLISFTSDAIRKVIQEFSKNEHSQISIPKLADLILKEKSIPVAMFKLSDAIKSVKLTDAESIALLSIFTSSPRLFLEAISNDLIVMSQSGYKLHSSFSIQADKSIFDFNLIRALKLTSKENLDLMSILTLNRKPIADEVAQTMFMSAFQHVLSNNRTREFGHIEAYTSIHFIEDINNPHQFISIINKGKRALTEVLVRGLELGMETEVKQAIEIIIKNYERKNAHMDSENLRTGQMGIIYGEAQSRSLGVKHVERSDTHMRDIYSNYFRSDSSDYVPVGNPRENLLLQIIGYSLQARAEYGYMRNLIEFISQDRPQLLPDAGKFIDDNKSPEGPIIYWGSKWEDWHILMYLDGHY